jgi:hypothetical protein
VITESKKKGGESFPPPGRLPSPLIIARTRPKLNERSWFIVPSPRRAFPARKATKNTRLARQAAPRPRPQPEPGERGGRGRPGGPQNPLSPVKNSSVVYGLNSAPRCLRPDE